MVTRSRQRERGIALVYVGIFLLVMFGFTALGVDIARLAFTATEVQTVADSAARAGAQELGAQAGAPGMGIDRAKNIANRNYMNGAVAQTNNIDVDEGFYDSAARTFDCCTTHSDCCANVRAMYDWRCVNSADPRCPTARSAVLAMPHTPVNNIVAAVLGSANATTTVTKVAIASLSGQSTGCQEPPGSGCNSAADVWGCFCSQGVAPCLPIGVPDCQFPNPCDDGPGQCNLPSFTMGGPGVDTAVWTGFQSGHSITDIRGYLDQGLCNPPGNYTPPGSQGLFGGNNTIDVINGVGGQGQNQPFTLVQCVNDNHYGCSLDGSGNIIDGNGGALGGGGTVFQVPVFRHADCSAPATATQSIVGFATIQLTNVFSDGGSHSEIDFVSISHTDAVPPPGGGGCFASNCQVLSQQ